MSRLTLVAAVALVLAADASATEYYLTAKYIGVEPGEKLTITDYSSFPRLKQRMWAGPYNFRIEQGSGYAELGGAGDVFSTFCVDIANNVRLNKTYTWQAVEPTEAPWPDVHSDGKISPSEQLALQRLFGQHYTSSLTDSAGAAAFQAAVWEIVNESQDVWDIASGNFKADGVDVDRVNMLLATSSSYQGPLPRLMALTSPTAQDQLLVVGGPGGAEIAPEPVSFVTAMLGLGGLAGYLRKRLATVGSSR